MTRRLWMGLILGLGLLGGLAPARARAMQYGGGNPPPPPAPFPGLTAPGDPLSGRLPGEDPAQGPAGDPGEALPPGYEVLARGPIHEAFAMPIVYNPAPPLVCSKVPPDAIQETPPDQRPDGNDVEWIPGYWAWEDQRQDYIWVSGIWRDIPPGRQWIPGYWGEATGGYCWTAGFWATAEAQGGLDYLPTPPSSLEVGPNSPCPGDDYAWGPGQWVWQETQYRWKPGYWYQTKPNWVWNPATYQTTPSGCVYNSGYWDYNLDQRGVAFAPIACRAPVAVAGVAPVPIVYRPSCVLPVSGLMSSLFVQPNYGHYCFGDYYGASTTTFAGDARYVPWFEFRNNRVGFDPIYSSMACRPNRQPNWDRVYREEYQYRVAHPEYRPRPTYLAQRTYFQEHPRQNYPIASGYGVGSGKVGVSGYQANAGYGGNPGYGGSSITHPSATVPGSTASHYPNLGSGGAYHPSKLVEPFHQWAGSTNHPHSVVPVQADHRVQIASRQTAMANFQRQRSQQESLGKAHINRSGAAYQATGSTFRNQLPRSPVVAATAPRYGSRGTIQAPNHPVNQASYHPQFAAHHTNLSSIQHGQSSGAAPHQTEHHQGGRSR